MTVQCLFMMSRLLKICCFCPTEKRLHSPYKIPPAKTRVCVRDPVNTHSVQALSVLSGSLYRYDSTSFCLLHVCSWLLKATWIKNPLFIIIIKVSAFVSVNIHNLLSSWNYFPTSEMTFLLTWRISVSALHLFPAEYSVSLKNVYES